MITSAGDSVGHWGPVNTYALTINKNHFYLPSEIIPLVNHPLLPINPFQSSIQTLSQDGPL